MSRKRVSSPAATGGAGTFFEQHVDAYWLAQLLVRATPPILVDSFVAQVHFQTALLGWSTDDFLVVADNGSGTQRKLAGQVKQTFTVSARNEECKRAILDFWRDFNNPGQFSPENDRLVLVTLRGTNVLLKHFVGLLDCARVSNDPADFERRLTADGFLDDAVSAYCDDLSTIIGEHEGRQVSRAELWPFLRVLHVLSLDLNTPTAQAEATVRTLLAHTATKPNATSFATASWNELLALVGQVMPAAHSFRYEDLPETLRRRHSPVGGHITGAGAYLRAMHRHLALHTEYINQQARTSDGRTIRNILRFMLDWVQLSNDPLLLLLGDYGTGKTALGKQLARSHVGDSISSSARLPVFAPLRSWMPGTPLWHHLAALVKEDGLAINGREVEAMNHDGKLLLILDGFDELPGRFTEGDLAWAFDRVAEAGTANAKVLLSCRTHFFGSDAELSFIASSPDPPPGLSSSIPRVYLMDFSDAQIRRYTTSTKKAKAAQSLRRLRQLPGAWALAHRPIILQLLLEVIPAYGAEEHVGVHKIYRDYTTRWFRRQASRGVLTKGARVAFCEALALHQWDAGVGTVTEVDILRLLATSSATIAGVESQARVADVRTVALIIRDTFGNYEFSHQSFSEYFFAEAVARQLVRDVKQNTSEAMRRLLLRPLSENRVLFLQSIISELSTHDVVCLAERCAAERNDALTQILSRILLGITLEQARAIVTRPHLVESMDHQASRNLVWAMAEVASRLSDGTVQASIQDFLAAVAEHTMDEYVMWNAAYGLQKVDPQYDGTALLERRITVDWSSADILASLHRRAAVVAARNFRHCNPQEEWAELLRALAEAGSCELHSIEARYNAVRIIEHAAREGHIPSPIREHLHDSVRIVALSETFNYLQSNAVEALGAFDDPADRQFLKDLVTKDTGVYFRSKVHALHALLRADYDDTLMFVRKAVLRQVDPAVVEAMRRLLAARR